MNDYTIIILFGFIFFIANLAGGYHLDEQLKCPQNKKHTIVISKDYKKYFLFSYKKRRHKFLKVAYILEVAGYVEFLITLIAAGTFWLLKYIPNKNITLIIFFFGFEGANTIFSLSMYIYYKIKYK